jgi:hypothetical protein
VIGFLSRHLPHRGLIVPVRLVAMVFGGRLVFGARAVSGHDGGLLVRGRGPSMGAAGVAVAFGRCPVGGLGSAQRLFGPQLRTPYGLRGGRLSLCELFPPSLQLFGAHTSPLAAVTRGACDVVEPLGNVDHRLSG